MEEKKNKVFGLLGKNISYSFSRGYFAKKFELLGLNKHEYKNFDIQDIADFSSIIKDETCLKGINVTIPYKEEVMQYLDMLDDTAKEIGAVNTIKLTKSGNLKGYNTDVVGFENSISPYFKSHHKFALILGTGGASKAIAYALKKNKIQLQADISVSNGEEEARIKAPLLRPYQKQVITGFPQHDKLILEPAKQGSTQKMIFYMPPQHREF